MKELKGKVAFVTGGSSGIGLGIVKMLAEEGMKVAFTYRNEAHRDETMAYFAKHPDQQVLPVKLDVVDREAFVRVADEVERTLGPVQVLVNNAGVSVGLDGVIEKATYSDWDWIISINIGGVINGIMTFLPRMRASGREAHIVNVSSIGGVAALGSLGLYTTTKFAVLGLSEALRTDMIGQPIGVSVYCPGPTKSNIGESPKNRPAYLAEAGHQAAEAPADEEPHPMMVHAMEATEAGRYVVEGIKQNKLFIFSHPEFRDVILARNAALAAAIPDVPIDQARADAARWLLSNPIYDAGA